MNAINHPHIFMRSLATREAGSEVSGALPDAIAACKVAGFDLVVVETSGIGQGDAAIVPLVDAQYVDARQVARLGEVNTLVLLESLTRLQAAKVGLVEAARDEAIAAIDLDEIFGPVPSVWPSTPAPLHKPDGGSAAPGVSYSITAPTPTRPPAAPAADRLVTRNTP